MTEGFDRHVPPPNPIEHTRVFTRDEIRMALLAYLRNNGVTVPDGRTTMYITTRDYEYGESEDNITITIYEEQDKP